MFKKLSNKTEEVLWSGFAGPNTSGGTGSGTIELSQPYTRFKRLRLYFVCFYNGNERPYINEISTEQLRYIHMDMSPVSHTLSSVWGYSNLTDYFDIKDSSTSTSLEFSATSTQCRKIEGIR